MNLETTSINVVIIGKSGQLAKELIDTLPANIDALALGRKDIGLSSKVDIEDKITKHNATLVINAAAYTAVDNAEDQQTAAFELNEQAVINIATTCNKLNIKLIHVSTDFVFDGKATTPYQPSSLTNPINVYGQSKLAGEVAVSKYAPNIGTTIRTSWVYSVHGNNFVKTMLGLMQNRDSLNIVGDQYGSPTWARGLAEFIWSLASLKTYQPIYHWCDEGITTWHHFADTIQKTAYKIGLLTNDTDISAIPASEYPTKAKRPVYSALDCSDSAQIKAPNKWQVNLELMLNIYNSTVKNNN